MAAPPSNFRQLIREAVDSIPAIDAHAHNLVHLDSHFPFARCFSESEGDALSFAPHSLSFKRSVRDIAQLYECPPSLDGVDSYRKSQGLASVAAKCFGAANISAVLLDDGLVSDKMLDLQSHKAFVPGAVARILRIEYLAETILNDEKSTGEKVTLDSFTEVFLTKIKSVADKIVGLKSIAAYRSGLEIDPCVSEIKAEEGLLQELNGSKPIRITNKSLIDYIFTRSLELAASLDLPMQIHTGFGDKDLDLRKSNPLHLRAVLEDKRFAKSKIVLLHASYPFSEEASYLASAYSQVYLDFGLAIPKLSVHGMISSVKALLELAPINKVMFSTDGYAFPETFYLGAKRSRDVVFTVLSDACGDGDLTLQEALQAVKDIFRENAMRLYKLNYSAGLIESESIVTQYTVPKHIGNSQNGDVVFVRIIWVDASGQHRCRVVPAGRFYEVVKTQGVGLTVVSMGMTSFMDGPAEGSNLTAVGEIRLVPDMTTISRLPWSTKEEMVLAAMHVKPGEAWEYCPRSVLLWVSRFLQKEFNLVMNAGFENEFYILKKIEGNGNEEWGPFDLTPYCSTSSFDAASSMLQEACSFLQSLNISVEQLHAEAGKGQFEMAFKYLPCNLAADNIIYAREVIRSVARKHGLLATFVPKFDLKDIGSGSHVHISLSENGQNVFIGSEDDPQTRYGISKIGQSFLAGVYHHLPSILAFTAPLPNSYDRIKPDTWSGAYHCWGKENREAPLRTACPPGVPLELVSNFEIKSFDGCANPHLGLAAILAAGLDGLRSSLTLPEPTETNPSDYSTKLKRLPKDLGEAVSALEQDVALKELIGEKLVTAVIAIRKAEIDYYNKNPWTYKDLIHRY